MPRPRRIPSSFTLGLLALFTLSGMFMADHASAALSPAPSPRLENAASLGEAKATLVGPRRVVVRDLPSAAVTATGQAREVLAPRRFPPEWTPGPLSPTPAANALDAAFSGESELNTPPAVSTADFEGLDNDENGALTGFITRPPDPQLAVGPNHVFEMVNIAGRIYGRTGATLQSFSLASFFGVPSGYKDTDPKIIYDALSGRWFASYVSLRDLPGPNNDEGRLHLAISQTNDPTGAWNVYFLTYSQIFPDYAGIGVTNDKFTISSNIFDIDQPFYFGEQTVVIEKADVIAGVAGNQVGLHAFAFNLSRFTVRPAHSLSSVNDQYLVTRSDSSSTTLTVIRITGTPDAGNVTAASSTNLTIISQTAPPVSATAGSGGAFDSGDERLLDAMWRDGHLWTSASAACIPSGDTSTRSCAHLIEVNATPPTTPSIAQDIMFGAPGEYYSWPAVRTDASGDAYVSLTHSNSTIFAEARAAGRLAGEPLNTMSGSTLLRAGDVVYTGGRWGDYLAAAVDPNFPECAWLVGQYAKDTAASSLWDWGTYIAATSYSDGCDADNDGWTSGMEAIIGTNPALACGTNANPADFNGDCLITGFDLSAVASDIGQTVPPGPARKDIAPDPPDGQISGADLSAVASRIGQALS